MNINLARKLITLCLVSLLCTALHSQACQQNQNHPGYKILSQVITSETITREFILHIPTNYDATLASPLLINMHGFGDCAGNYAETIGGFYEFDALANQENLIVAYPQGAYRPDKDDHYWEPGDNGAEDIFKNDVYFIEQLVETIASEYNVDRDRVYAAGYSNGGMMAYSLACNNTDLFSGIGIMSGVMLEEACDLDYAIPIIVFHGVGDEVLPYEGNIWYQSTQEIVNYWLAKNNIPPSSLVSTELKDGDVIRNEYSGGSANTCLSFYTINEEYDKPGDHVWFSEPIEGSTPNEIMWNFFKANCSNLVSTEATQITKELIIYPNPFLDVVTIQLENIAKVQYEIYNSQGVSVKTGELNHTNNTIDLAALSPMVYMISINGRFQKLIKTN